MIEAVIYLLVIAGAEAVSVFYSPPWGILCHIIISIAIIVHSALVSNNFHQRLLIANKAKIFIVGDKL